MKLYNPLSTIFLQIFVRVLLSLIIFHMFIFLHIFHFPSLFKHFLHKHQITIIPYLKHFPLFSGIQWSTNVLYVQIVSGWGGRLSTARLDTWLESERVTATTDQRRLNATLHCEGVRVGWGRHGMEMARIRAINRLKIRLIFVGVFFHLLIIAN